MTANGDDQPTPKAPRLTPITLVTGALAASVPSCWPWSYLWVSGSIRRSGSDGEFPLGCAVESSNPGQASEELTAGRSVGEYAAGQRLSGSVAQSGRKNSASHRR